MMRSSISIRIDAPAGLVYDLARDVQRWPALLPHYRRVDVLHGGDGPLTARMVAVRSIGPLSLFGIPVAWRSRTWSEPAPPRIHFRHLGGATNGMAVTWRIEPDGHGCRVTIEHDFRPRVALWAQLVERLFVRPIAGRTLQSFKAIAEATVASLFERSTAAPKTKTST